MTESHDIRVEKDYWENMLNEVDKNKDGKISFEEFEAAMTQIVMDQADESVQKRATKGEWTDLTAKEKDMNSLTTPQAKHAYDPNEIVTMGTPQ